MAFCCDCELRADPEKQNLSFLIRRSYKSWFQGSESKLFAETVSYKLVLRSRISAFCRHCQLEVGPERQNLSLLLRLSAKSCFWEAESELFAETVPEKLILRIKISAFRWDCQLAVGSEKQDLSFLQRLLP